MLMSQKNEETIKVFLDKEIAGKKTPNFCMIYLCMN